MPLKIEIEICDRGSVSVFHRGDTGLLIEHGPDALKIVDEIRENARLDVRPKNVLEKYLDAIGFRSHKSA